MFGINKGIDKKTNNSRTIGDAYWSKQKEFKIIKEKADMCSDKEKEIEKSISECKNIIELVFKNLYPERKQLGIFLLSQNYSHDGKDAKWRVSEKEVKDNKRWIYSEVCLNTMGISLLSIGGVKSNSMLEGRSSNWLYNLIALKDKIAMDKLKELLKEEKLEILNKALENIEVLEYESEFIKEQPLKYFRINTAGNSFKKDNKSSKYIKFDVSCGGVRCYLLNKKESSYEDNDFNLESLGLDDAIIVEQTKDELISALEEYHIYLEQKSNMMLEHLNKLKGYFTKQLIIMTLTKGEKTNDN
jgi:hypothetical protein